ncbi:NUDIX domain-containing protein [Candidatus Nomurabacteria bacterium]|nr:NUDIX domain-containing protein [Candidatus Nomurabacteria bacterium]
MSKIIKIIFKILHSIRKWYWRTFRIKTFGARVLLEKEGKVFLVQHRYNNYWVFPGGSMKKGENADDLCRREVFEETGLIVTKFAKRLGTYKNNQEGKNDTLTILVANDFKKGPRWNFFQKIMQKVEIKDAGWFDIDNLPNTISDATKRRIEEYKNEQYDLEGKW